jgi:hypothetical protein
MRFATTAPIDDHDVRAMPRLRVPRLVLMAGSLLLLVALGACGSSSAQPARSPGGDCTKSTPGSTAVTGTDASGVSGSNSGTTSGSAPATGSASGASGTSSTTGSGCGTKGSGYGTSSDGGTGSGG